MWCPFGHPKTALSRTGNITYRGWIPHVSFGKNTDGCRVLPARALDSICSTLGMAPCASEKRSGLVASEKKEAKSNRGEGPCCMSHGEQRSTESHMGGVVFLKGTLLKPKRNLPGATTAHVLAGNYLSNISWRCPQTEDQPISSSKCHLRINMSKA